MPTFRPHSSANVERIEFAKRLIALMRDKNLNQTDLAKKSGLTRDAVSTYCRARSMPEPINLAKLAKALGVEPAYFQLDVMRLAEKMVSPTPVFKPPANDIGTVHYDKDDFDYVRVDNLFTVKITPEGDRKFIFIKTVPKEKANELIQILGNLLGE